MVKARHGDGGRDWVGASPAELRAAVHACLAKLLLSPDGAEAVEVLRDASAAPAMPRHVLAAGIADVPAAWDASLGGVPPIDQEWTDLFRVPMERHVAPYESVHAPPEGRPDTPAGPSLLSMTTEELRDLYDAAGYEVDPSHADLPDHAGVELGFMACLVAHEARVHASGAEGQIRDARRAQQAFLSRHPARWLDALADRVTASARLPLYPSVARVAARLVRAELAELAGSEDPGGN